MSEIKREGQDRNNNDSPFQGLRPTRAEIDLEALSYNIRNIRGSLAGQKIYAVVKANAYGHGVIPVARRLAEQGVEGFAVALIEEGVELRENHIDNEILVLNGPYAGSHETIINYRLTPVISSAEDVRVFQSYARGRRISIHLNVDTGMSRLGLPFEQLPDFIDQLRGSEAIHLKGLMTHLARADDDPETTREQLARFSRAKELISRHGFSPEILHAANSAAVIRHPEAHFDAVRVGLALYGLDPAGSGFPLKPILSLKSRIISLRSLPANQGVGYNHTFRTSRPTRLATIPIGYGDGYLRAISNKGFVLIGGRRCPVVGNISMDLTTVDVTDLDACRVGDEVVIIGEQAREQIRAEDLARWAGTINYEIVTNISQRVPRYYG